MRSGSRGKMKYQTGLKVDGILEAGDHRKRTGVDIRPPFILGEDPHFADRAVKKLRFLFIFSLTCCIIMFKAFNHLAV